MSNGIGSSRHFLQGGTPVPEDELNAVGRVSSSIGGCTGTLVTDRLVLTAAHCMCSGQTTRTGCVSRATFTFVDVLRPDDPSTPVDESSTRANVSVGGDVLVHPDYAAGGVWLLNDYALLRLDTPASEIANVTPIPIERPENVPVVGDTLTLVGFGLTGSNCMSSAAGKQSVDVQVDAVSDATIVMNDTGSYSCPGDSGGPALNGAGRVVGVASSANFSSNSNYDPTYAAYQWIFGTGRILRLSGRVSFLRIHELGTGFGPPSDPIDGEVVVRLDTQGSALGFPLRTGPSAAAQRAQLELLRTSFVHGGTVHLEYEVTGPNNGRIIRVTDML